MLFRVINDIYYGRHVDVWTVAAQVLSILFIIFCILPLHELAHGWVANKLGDPTAKRAGRLTLNPLASIEPIGALALLLFGFGWAKPVPVQPGFFKNPKRGMALTALAGPVSNLLAALAGALAYCVVVAFAPYNAFVYFIIALLSYYVWVNVVLAIFNLIPIPPLDGSRIIGAFLSDRFLAAYYRYQNYSMIFLFLFLFLDNKFEILTPIENFVSQGIFTIASFPFRLAGVL